MTSDDIQRTHMQVDGCTYIQAPCGWVRVTEVEPVTVPMSLLLNRLQRELDR